MPMADVDLARHQWEEGRRAVERSRNDRNAYAGLNRRIGQNFTLAELAAVYAGADRWVLETIDEAFPDESPGPVSAAADAAFDMYSRRASDYAP